MSKSTTLVLLIAGAIFTAIGQIEIPALDSFRVAAAGLGFTLAALARSEALVRAPNERAGDPPAAP